MINNISVRMHHVLDKECFKIIWTDATSGASFPAYLIPTGPVFEVTQKLRLALGNLVKLVINDGVEESSATLRQIAALGESLHESLFTGDSLGDSLIAKKIRDWIGQISKSDRIGITFVVGSKVHVPWGLIYEREFAGPCFFSSTECWRFENFRDFWCVKYGVTSVYDRITPLGLSSTFRSSQYKILPAIDDNVWTAATCDVDADELQNFQNILNQNLPVVNSKSELFGSWQKNKKDIGILLFYCHANGRYIDLGDGEILSHSELRLNLKREEASIIQPPTLIFLAGCNTAVGDHIEAGFLEVTGAAGFCGFIGTEAEMPDVFGLRFTMSFLSELYLSGKSLGTVMQDFREAHWPLSLIFSISCPSMITLSNEWPVDAAGSVGKNYSLMNTSSKGHQ